MIAVRFFVAVARAGVDANGILRGHYAVFDQPTTRQSDYVGTETIGRTAFESLAPWDTVATFNHDPSLLLGRLSNETLRLPAADDTGQPFEVDLPDTSVGRDVATLVKRGDLRGMSFLAEVGDVERTSGGVVHRAFKTLYDVSVVTNPAYTGTDVAARSAAVNAAALRDQLIRLRHRALTGGTK